MQNTIGNFAVSFVSKLLFIMAATISLPALSVPLTGSGDLPFPGDTGAPDIVHPTYVDSAGSFTGTWDSQAASAWHGTFTGTPDRIVTTSSNTGINTLDFSGLVLGILPVNTFVALGDLDAGSASSELISFRAWDTLGRIITRPWLEEPSYQDGLGTQVAEMLPNYEWDSGTSTYTFDGNGETWLGNPATGVYMLTNQEILTMEINDQTSFAGFGISAPRSQSPQVPEPATFLLFCTGLIGLVRYKKNRLLNQSC